MFKASSVLKAGVATIAASGLVLGAAVSANADPIPAGTFRTYAAVGSDTTQDVWNGLGASLDVGSYNAFPITASVTTIQTKAAGATFARPSGSGNGVKALSAAWDPANHVWSGTTLSPIDVDFARSSSGPAAAGSDLTYLRFARDAVSVAYNPYSEASVDLNTSQLAEIYSGVNNTANDSTATTVAIIGGVPKINGNEVFPKLPQSGSGTRNFFIAAIGSPVLASYVDAASTLQENNGTVLTTDGSLIPFSAAQWIAQKKGTGGVTDTTGTLLLASINGQAPTNGAATAAALAPGALYGAKNVDDVYDVVPATGAGVFNRDTFNVVPSSFLGSSATAAQKALVNKLTTGLQTQEIIDTITSYGFGNLSYLGNSSLTSAYQH